MQSTDEILQEANEIFKDVLENDDIKLTPVTTADDIEEWDSLTHIQLIVGLEKYFKIRFSTSEITSYKNVGEMIAGIRGKLNK
jgi:acyl carrier protein